MPHPPGRPTHTPTSSGEDVDAGELDQAPGDVARGSTEAGEPYLAMDWLAGEDSSRAARRCGAATTTFAIAWQPAWPRGQSVELAPSAQVLRDPSEARRAVEGACLHWDTLRTDTIELARITLTAQACCTPEALSRAVRIGFSPWHALDAHRPLGSLKRARRAVYSAQSAARR